MDTILRLAVNGNIVNHRKGGIGIEKRIVPTKEKIREARRPMSDYRLRPVGFFEGVIYVEDSHSRNVNSAWWALEETKGPIVWIAGGIDKGNDYTLLVPLVVSRVSVIVLLGRDNRLLRKAFGKMAIMTPNCLSMDEAVLRARELAVPGSTILLAPACASFDLFENYEHRADEFRRSVALHACKSPTMW
jgi:UDP-N-acetylmuramoylalanine--D-glutamate ligase